MAAGRDLLRAAGADGIAIEIPDTAPPSVIVLGAEDQIGKLLRSLAPPLASDEPGAGPRGWTILLSGDGGVVGKQGSTFETAAAHLERVDVVEALPVLRQVAELQRERVRDAVADALTGVYYCGRVWSAWGVGTMGEDDFTPADQVEEVLDSITDAAIAALASRPGALAAPSMDPRAAYEAWELSEAAQRKGEPLDETERTYVLTRWPGDRDTYNICPHHWPAFKAGHAAALAAIPATQQGDQP